MIAPTMPDLKSLPFGGAQYVVSDHTENFVRTAILESIDAPWQDNVHSEFLSLYQQWLRTSRSNSFAGLGHFNHAVFSAGTTESFDVFYHKNSQRRLRYFHGEYMYHQVAARQHRPCGGAFLEDAPLDRNDAVIISLPFSDTGGEHSDMQSVLNQCDRLGIPVLLDCAYFGICSNMIFDLDHDCITDVTFSLSKSFPVPHLRIGMRLTRTDDDDTLFVLNKTRYVNRVSAMVGIKILENFGPDYIPNLYRSAQQVICHDLSVDVSPCVIFGIDRNNRYPEYNRGGPSNRLNLAKILDQRLIK
jgi:histidinol-phosphate/aromatic aminotransferase/cobyric acid decarboxylase-like protein